MVKVRIAAVFATVVAAILAVGPVAAGPVESNGYKVLKPIESGDLTLFPVVRAGGKMPPADQFLTLDEGLKNGEVEVTEAGRVRGLVRSRGGAVLPYRGDQVNTLVLVNNSKRPLLLLAGEIVTGGKQDRVIAKDRIVPAGGDPIDLSVFCIEHGRWTESSEKFGATAKTSVGSRRRWFRRSWRARSRWRISATATTSPAPRSKWKGGPPKWRPCRFELQIDSAQQHDR